MMENDLYLETAAIFDFSQFEVDCSLGSSFGAINLSLRSFEHISRVLNFVTPTLLLRRFTATILLQKGIIVSRLETYPKKAPNLSYLNGYYPVYTKYHAILLLHALHTFAHGEDISITCQQTVLAFSKFSMKFSKTHSI
jgi:hypothetical protein